MFFKKKMKMTRKDMGRTIYSLVLHKTNYLITTDTVLESLCIEKEEAEGYFRHFTIINLFLMSDIIKHSPNIDAVLKEDVIKYMYEACYEDLKRCYKNFTDEDLSEFKRVMTVFHKAFQNEIDRSKSNNGNWVEALTKVFLVVLKIKPEFENDVYFNIPILFFIKYISVCIESFNESFKIINREYEVS